MKRRQFVAALGCAMASVCPRTAGAQAGRAGGTAATNRFNADAFREGLAQAGFVEGRNVLIEERWANGDYQALPVLAAELVARGGIAIAATGDVVSARAAKNGRSSVPVVFTIGGDPIRFGLVASVNRPGGHVTGISFVPDGVGARSACSCCRSSSRTSGA